MELIAAGLIKVLGSAGFGTVFGGIMGYFNRKADLAVKKLELEDRERQRAHELKQRELDVQIMEREAAAKVKVAEIEGESRVESEAYSALARSYDFAKPAAGSKMEAFSSFVRPAISLAYFLVSSFGAGFILHRAFVIVQVEFSPAQWFDLANFVIDWIAFMASTTVGWWFAMRPGKMPQIRGAR